MVCSLNFISFLEYVISLCVYMCIYIVHIYIYIYIYILCNNISMI